MLNHAYTAGLIDGEGYVSILPNYHGNRLYYIPCVKVASVTPVITNYLHENYGGHITYRIHKNKNQRPSYSWELKNMSKVYKFLDLISKFLLCKNEQTKLVMDFCLLPKNNSPLYKRYDPKINEIKKDIYWKLRTLNHRGTSPATTERKNPY